MLKNVLSFSHLLIKEAISPGETVIDATAGKGNDTLLLSRVVGNSGKVLAFDIQEEAIQATRALLHKEKQSNVSLFHHDHSFLESILIEEQIREVGGAIFNLGYLPGSSKKVITRPVSTLTALTSILSRLKRRGIVVLVVYYGHEGGDQEKTALLDYCSELDQKSFHVLKYDFINQKNNPPFLLAIEKRKG